MAIRTFVAVMTGKAGFDIRHITASITSDSIIIGVTRLAAYLINTGGRAMAIRTFVAGIAFIIGFNFGGYAACRTIAINPTCIGRLGTGIGIITGNIAYTGVTALVIAAVASPTGFYGGVYATGRAGFGCVICVVR